MRETPYRVRFVFMVSLSRTWYSLLNAVRYPFTLSHRRSSVSDTRQSGVSPRSAMLWAVSLVLGGLPAVSLSKWIV